LRESEGNSLDLFANETLYQLSYDPNLAARTFIP
jgi:hypothetical protein